VIRSYRVSGASFQQAQQQAQQQFYAVVQQSAATTNEDRYWRWHYAIKTQLFRQSYLDIIVHLVCGCSRRGSLGSYYVRQRRYVMPGVCLYVCLSVSLLAQAWINRSPNCSNWRSIFGRPFLVITLLNNGHFSRHCPGNSSLWAPLCSPF